VVECVMAFSCLSVVCFLAQTFYLNRQEKATPTTH